MLLTCVSVMLLIFYAIWLIPLRQKGSEEGYFQLLSPSKPILHGFYIGRRSTERRGFDRAGIYISWLGSHFLHPLDFVFLFLINRCLSRFFSL